MHAVRMTCEYPDRSSDHCWKVRLGLIAAAPPGRPGHSRIRGTAGLAWRSCLGALGIGGRRRLVDFRAEVAGRILEHLGNVPDELLAEPRVEFLKETAHAWLELMKPAVGTEL